MAVIEINKEYLEKLVGCKLTEKDYTERIPLFGCPLEKMDEISVNFEIEPNRPDLLSVEGFARAIKLFLSKKPKLTVYKTTESGIKLKVDKSVKPVRPEIVCAIVRDVKITDDLISSIMQVQEKIHDTLGRKRKKVAIGIHDMSKVTPPFIYKAVKPESVKFVPLDMDRSISLKEILEIHPKGINYADILKDSEKYPIILDKNEKILSFPPIINGELTRVTKGTNELFIDITGTDYIAINQALKILVTSFADRGCKIETVRLDGEVKRTTPDLSRWKIKADDEYINKLLGLELDKNEIETLLKKMDIGMDGNYATIPPYRADIMHQIDIVEEVAIAYGYDNFEPTIPNVPTIGKPLEKKDFYFSIKEIMIGFGFQEVINLTLSNYEDEFDKMNVERKSVAETMNSVTPECNIFRRNLLPSLIDVISKNQHYEYPQKIFELGDAVELDEEEETGTKNLKFLSCVIADMSVSYEDISSVLDGVMNNIGIGYNLRKYDHPSFIEGRAAKVFAGKKAIGTIGEINPKVMENWNINVPVVAFEIDLNRALD